MSKRYRIATVALGLILLTGSGQAQEETQGGQGDAAQQQAPAQPLPLPFPVIVVEDEAAAEARQRSEEEAAQREKHDLVAQQGMNSATQAMNEATQRMALYNLISTALVGVGTGLLIVTLHLTRQANKAAREAVEVTRDIGQAQTRAYLHVASATYEAEPSSFVITISIKNSGPTPARILDIVYRLMVYETTLNTGPIIGPFDPSDRSVTPGVAAADTDTALAYWKAADLGQEVYGRLCNGSPQCTAMIDLIWIDVYKRKQESRFIVNAAPVRGSPRMRPPFKGRLTVQYIYTRDIADED